MVSIEEQSDYWLPLRDNRLISFFIDYLNEKSDLIPIALNASDNDSIVCNILTYIRDNNIREGKELYDKIVVRNIRSDSEWIHNDYFVFSLICLVKKFNLNVNWIKELILTRPSNDEIQRIVNKTFENILSGNYNSRGDLYQLSIVCQLIIQKLELDNNRMNEMFAFLWKNSFPYFDSEFLNIISLRAIRVAFEEKGLMNPEEKFIAQKFAKYFIDKVNFISDAITFTLFITVIIALTIGAAFFSETTLWKSILGSLAALGLGAGFFSEIRSWLNIKLANFIKWFWGYRPPDV